MLKTVTVHDIIAGIVAIILAVTIATLAIEGKEIPEAVTTTLGVSLGYLFRGVSATVQTVAGSLSKLGNGSQTNPPAN